jgi:hypothetical protein
MKRALALVSVLTGCGRIDFEPIDDPGVAGCPAGYTDAAPGCYRVVANPPVEPVWIDAEAACEADGPGAHLVVVGDLAEAQRIWTLIPAGLDDHYIGASDRVSEGVYLTVTNQAMTFLTWGTSEPDGGFEDCMSLTSAQQVLDTDCDNPNDYVCEYDGIAAVPSAWGQ